jgi:hypothetical protein
MKRELYKKNVGPYIVNVHEPKSHDFSEEFLTLLQRAKDLRMPFA